MEKKVVFVQLLQELVWWVITAVVCIAVLKPVTEKINYDYLIENAFFIVAGITTIRYFLFFNSLFFLKNKWVRFVFFTMNFVLWVYVLNRYEMLLQTIDYFDIGYFGMPLKPLTTHEHTTLLQYLYKEILLSGLCALLGFMLLNLRFVGSYWRVAKVRFTTRMQT